MCVRIASGSLIPALNVLLACVVGCRCGPDPAPMSDPNRTCPALVAAAGSVHYPIRKPSDVAVSLVSPGKEPRRSLRYELTQGEHFAFDVVPIARADDRGEAGRMSIHVEGTVACVAASVARIDYRIGLNGAVHEEALAYALVSKLGMIEDGGVVSSGEVDERGLTHPREGLSSPLPTVPVGIGAVWEVSRTLDNGARQHVTFEIVSMNDTTVQTRTGVRLETREADTDPMRGHGETTIELRAPVSAGWFLMLGPQGAQAGLRVIPL